jgi:cupin 2 domain-containing protein
MGSISNLYKYNIFDFDVPERGESFHTLFSERNVRIETIVSSDTPEKTLYNQSEGEWVMLIEGEAQLEIDGQSVVLHPGDTIFIPAETPHRVLETKKGTRWLAVHMDSL